MWRTLVGDLLPAAVFADPVGEAAIERAQTALGVVLPQQLVSLLGESNGITGDYGLGLVWDLDRIVRDNLSFRANEDFAELYMPFEPLLFFGDAGNGDQFALLSPPVERDDVFVWDHETDSRTWGAPDVATYLRWWLEGRLTT